MTDPRQEVNEAAAKVGVGTYTRHVFLCVGPSCCTPEEGMRAWEVLKKEIKERGLTTCARTKVGCLRICCHGPTAVVYPEGIWYHGMTAERIPQLVQSHLIEGKPLTELTFANAPLTKEESAR
jgi:(2Fe-2S) ferredoxin